MIEHTECLEYEELVARWDAGELDEDPRLLACPVCRARTKRVGDLLRYLTTARLSFTD